MPAFDFFLPTYLQFGAGVFDRAARLARHMGKHALLVTSRSAVEDLGYTPQLASDLHGLGIGVTYFRDFQRGPTTDDVDRGADAARNEKADFVIGLGGGSALDCAKAIAGVARGNRPAADYLYGRTSVTSTALPLMAIPTTAGSGSEMNKSAMVTDPERQFKDGIRSPHLFPSYAVVDPLLTHSVPRDVTAQTGFDVLAHAVESYVSPKAQPLTDALALRAIAQVCRSLPVALEEPENAVAREELALAATTMGINLAAVGTCFPHRADKSLCGLHPEIAHGQSVAIFYPHWARSCFHGAAAKFAAIVETMRPGQEYAPTEQQAAAFPDIVTEMLGQIGLDRTMADFGVSDDEIPRLAENVAGDLNVNPVPVEREDLERIFIEVLNSSSN